MKRQTVTTITFDEKEIKAILSDYVNEKYGVTVKDVSFVSHTRSTFDAVVVTEPEVSESKAI